MPVFYPPVNLSIGGNTSGVSTLINTGTATFAGGNNITLSQNGNAITISGAATVAQSEQTQSRFNLTASGNTAGALALVSSGVLTLAGGNNVTLSQAGNAITISAFNQTAQSEQTQSRFNLTLSGNTSGALALVSSGVLTLAGGNNITLSQAGNAITISGGAGGAGFASAGMSSQGNSAGTSGLVGSQLVMVGGNNVTLSQSVNGASATLTVSAFNQSVQTQDRFNFVIGGNTSGTTASVSSGTLSLVGGNNITLSQNANTITVSAGGEALSYFDNMDWGSASAGLAQKAAQYQSLWVFPFTPAMAFPGRMTASSAFFDMSISGIAVSASHTSSIYFGVYTVNANGVSLDLVNSVSTSFGSAAANANQSSAYSGMRYWSLHNSLFSSSPVFVEGRNYVGAFLLRSAGSSAAVSIIGQYLQSTAARSGVIGVAQTTGTSQGFGMFYGHYSTTTTNLPAAIGNAELNKQAASCNFVPHMIFNNFTSNF